MSEGSMFPMDPVVRRVAGAFLLFAAVGLLLVFMAVVGDGPVPFPAGLLVLGVGAGLGGVGGRLLVWPLGRRRP